MLGLIKILKMNLEMLVIFCKKFIEIHEADNVEIGWHPHIYKKILKLNLKIMINLLLMKWIIFTIKLLE